MKYRITVKAAGHKSTEQVPAEREADETEPLTHDEAAQYLRPNGKDEE